MRKAKRMRMRIRVMMRRQRRMRRRIRTTRGEDENYLGQHGCRNSEHATKRQRTERHPQEQSSNH
eukprot:770788-Pyramimonas_sp.AAC.1